MRDLKPHSQSPIARVHTAPRRVLILESDRLIRQLIVEWLHMASFETLCASDPASAIRIAGSGGCELILADVEAPFKSARETVTRLAHALPNTPIIAMSADALASGPSASDAIARELGVMAVLVKPFTQDALLNAIKRARISRGSPPKLHGA